MKAVLEKELWSYLGNWSAWIIIAVFSLVSGLFLFFFENNFNFFDIGSASMQSYFVLVPWLLMFIIPALSMKSLAEEGRTMLIVTHEMRFARDVSSQVVFLHQGKIEEIGTPSEVFDNPKSQRVKDFMASHQG